MVGAMPADAQTVVTSAFADTPVDIRGRVREIVATRTIADRLLDERLAASVSRIEGVDQAGLAELASEGLIVEQNVVYHRDRLKVRPKAYLQVYTFPGRLRGNQS